jgi:large subunit ribosomal protein L25
MSKQVTLPAHPRVGAGKSEASRLRREGRIPAIAYGPELEATPLSVDGRDLFHALNTDAGANAILRLEFDGQTQLALAREIQRHPVRREVLHVDFLAVSRNVKVSADIPIRIEGDAPGVDEGGVAEQPLHTLPIEVLPLEMPDEFVLDISDMQIGDVKRVSDMDIPEGIDVLEDPERTVVTVYWEAVETEPAEGEEAAEAEAEGATAAEAEGGEDQEA